MQLAAPLSLAAYTTPLAVDHAVWFEIAVAGAGLIAGWPMLSASTNYWVVLAPGTPLALSHPGDSNGVLWTGLDITTDAVPVSVLDDNTGGNLYTVRAPLLRVCKRTYPYYWWPPTPHAGSRTHLPAIRG